MSEERGKRDGRSEEEFENSSASDDVAPGSEGRPSDADTTAGESAADAVVPTGKRSTSRSRGSASGVSMSKAPAASTAPAKAKTGRTRSGKVKADKRPNVFLRLLQFFREVVAELRKVIWPNKKQMVTYTSVVLVFLTFMVAYISGLDLLFIQGVGWLFG
ncbi:preprotein translocase subunit SecE [Rhodococcus sp. 05-340-1]|uniref:preprotein translocase subunit SecE n=1 Tax=Nocardiaceae TaxID=85025 RepID=UPI000565E4F1|nr:MULTISPECIES: preprotein translocase subunit SecE [Rhodococcus]OZD73633.1 preprotein translocase subunit SecE [Rhodococcus sp. 05-340-2]OZD85049.1 preprotein translocase subunit SecE [Rhodococcus sp. 05-340-1]OZE95851.1 preprotein translocase subunit SecE [Rhodococcus sp. 15-2388-1-1a]OZF32864.1 preprotein translocase subunit SecE [Rhodococcus sp. 14-2483-1-2]